ncbi:MAG: DUF3850 domain-containing protein [Coprobacillus sp.]
MKHKKKILPKYFNAILDGTKKFEIRKEDDCRFEVGDLIELIEIANGRGIVHNQLENKLEAVVKETGRKQLIEITYRLDSNDFPEGIKEGYVVIGIKLVGNEE